MQMNISLRKVLNMIFLFVSVNSEMSSNSKVEADLAASKPIGQSTEDEDIQSDDMILDELEDEETAGNASMLVTGFFFIYLFFL